MGDFDYHHERLAAQQIRERVETRQRSAVPDRRRRRTGRAAVAARLHRLADRIGLSGTPAAPGRPPHPGRLRPAPGRPPQIWVRWKFAYDRDGVGPRWPW